jgi:hypothetical protein
MPLAKKRLKYAGSSKSQMVGDLCDGHSRVAERAFRFDEHPCMNGLNRRLAGNPDAGFAQRGLRCADLARIGAHPEMAPVTPPSRATSSRDPAAHCS